MNKQVQLPLSKVDVSVVPIWDKISLKAKVARKKKKNMTFILKQYSASGVMVCAYNPRTLEAETGRL